ncbi:hypothetical protein MLPF_1191 [Mycobacterium lepromatosis]|uniref:Uncharacterized protein n=1 Tax=Mycobacterium lepromatosis TaxID=480418 RepID=A0A0F4ERE9_9MYCO|nr:hypothetical protein [Mycobacterium lepromatosis]KJX75521.1 hypothetical protein MLPM_0755 [Mycobacterium lepromatosis]UKN42064.1 hypothetical protein MLPF_1191 [Mycobacterium lepromatosis]
MALRGATQESGVTYLRITPELTTIHVHPVTYSPSEPTQLSGFAIRGARARPAAHILVNDGSEALRWWSADALPPKLAKLAVARKSARSHASADLGVSRGEPNA